MGHSSIQVTMDLYGHLFPGMGSELAERLDALHGQLSIGERSSDRRAKGEA
jgi:hypothetical protein